VRSHRYALARTLAVPLGADEFGLHECDMPLCVKVCGADAPRRHVVIGDQGREHAAHGAHAARWRTQNHCR